LTNARAPTVIESTKTVPETLADLRTLFRRYDIEDWEPIPGDKDPRSYSVRYMQAGQWVTIDSYLQPSKDLNLRQCYQVIQFLFLWGNRGVGGVSQGVTFIHGALVPTKGASTNQLAEAYATMGVEASDSLEEIQSVYRAKIRHSHPDHAKDDDDRKGRDARTRRLNAAMDLITQGRS